MSEDSLVLVPAPAAGPVLVLSPASVRVVIADAQLVRVRDDAPPPRTVLAAAPSGPVVVTPPARSHVVLAGFAGPAGRAGADSADAGFVVTALVDLGAPRIVAVADGQAYYPDLTDSGDVQRIAGITSASAGAGSPVTIRPAATLSNALWAWTPGPIYCALTGGTLTQTAPATGAVLEVGKAISATQIVIQLHRAILRA